VSSVTGCPSHMRTCSFFVAFETRSGLMSLAATVVLCSTLTRLAAVQGGFGLPAGCYEVPHKHWLCGLLQPLQQAAQRGGCVSICLSR